MEKGKVTRSALHEKITAVHEGVVKTASDVRLLRATHVFLIVMALSVTALAAYLVYAVHDAVETLGKVREIVKEQKPKVERVENDVQSLISQTQTIEGKIDTIIQILD